MKTMGGWPQSWVIATVSGWVVFASGAITHPALAQFSSPPGQGMPKGTAGGGSRPTQLACLAQPHRPETLLAMAPTQFVGLTSQSHPTVWIYVPPTTATTVEFSLFTQEQEGLYQVNLPIATTGLLAIQLPEQISLTPGHPYYWTAAVVCNPSRRTEDWTVGGWIQQAPISPELHQRLTTASAAQQVKLYTQAGFWYEALNAYLKLQQQHPTTVDLHRLWTDLLQAAGMTTIAPPLSLSQANR